MKIIVLGTRGIPNIQGGVETHCEELYPRLVDLGVNVTLITRKSYVEDCSKVEYKGVKLKHIFTPKKTSIEAIVHTFLGVLYARTQNPDILHIHAIGPSLMVPFARLLGLKVVVTNHGPDYDRQKWGNIAKWVLKSGEKFGTKYANKVIVISNVIKTILEKKYNRIDTELIYNGVNFPLPSIQQDYIKSLELEKEKYIIAVGRFVEEKGFHDLIEAYKELETDVKLVLVGDADHESEYSIRLKTMAKKNNVVLTGFIKGEKLNQIFSHAKLFVMPSYHEGLPIALLEAMSYNLDVLVSDIPANLEVDLNRDDYFNTGNIKDLKIHIDLKLKTNINRSFIELIAHKYNWDNISREVFILYRGVL